MIWKSDRWLGTKSWTRLSLKSSSPTRIIILSRNPLSPIGETSTSLKAEGTPQDQDETGKEEFVDAQQDPELDSQLLVNAAAGKTQLNPADVRSALSTPAKRFPSLRIDTNTHEVIRSEAVPVYRVSNHLGHSSDTHGLQDRGANGGLAGSNMRIISAGDRRVHVSGIDNHEMTNLRIVSAGGAIIPSQRGDVIGIFHQYASTPH